MSTGERRYFTVLWIIACLVNLKLIFFSYCTDSAYTVVMADRLIRGDRLFFEMWEPHQTSALIPYLLEALFKSLFHTTDGIVVWFHICGMLFFLAGALSIIYLLKPYLPIAALHFMALLFFVIRPKYTNMPDYANMSVLFATFFWLFLVKYILEKKNVFLILCVIAGCGATFAYPSNGLLLVGLFIFLIFTDRRVTGCLIELVIGVSVFGLFVLAVCLTNKMTINELLKNCIRIFLSDSHSQERYTGWPYFSMAVYGCVFFVILSGLSYVTVKLIKKSIRLDTLLKTVALYMSVLVPIISCAMFAYSKAYNTLYDWFYFYLSIYVFVIICGFIMFGKSTLNIIERTIFCVGQAVNFGVFLNTCILTNLPLITVFGYLSVGVAAALIPIFLQQKNGENTKKTAFFFALCVFLIVSFFQIWKAGDASGKVSNIFEFDNYVRVGPEKYLGTRRAYCNQTQVGMQEWKAHVGSEDSVLLVGSYPFELVAYMYSDAKISNYSAISTPSFYREMLLEYWECFPDRVPTVIAVPCYQGNESWQIPQWLDDYRQSEYECTYTGTFWNFYTSK